MRVEWSRLTGEDTETVIAMLICCEYPRARRMRPSRGDGGIDVMLPLADGTWRVFQIKRFFEKLTSGQKYQAKKSLQRVQEFEKDRADQAAQGNGTAFPITQWTLVTPLLALESEHAWFAELTGDCGYQADWIDLDTIETWVARHPEIVDYYLHGGRGRLEEALGRLGGVMQLGNAVRRADDTGSPLAPAATVEGLLDLFRVVNELDPFYRYEYELSAGLPSREALLATPGMAFAESCCIAGQGCVTVKVFPRYDEALYERPIHVDVNVDLTSDDTVAQAVADYRRYGTDFTTPMGSTQIKADLPGGLGGDHVGAMRIFSRPATGERIIRIQAVALDGQVLAESRMRMNPPTMGVGGDGARVTGTEISGVFDLEVRSDLDTATGAQCHRFSFTVPDLSGRAPSDLLPGTQVLRHLTAPNGIRFAEPHGPVTHDASFPFEQTEPMAAHLLDLVADLAVVQEHTTHQVLLPDLDSATDAQLAAAARAARLLRGETLTHQVRGLRLTGAGVPANDLDGARGLTFERPLLLRLDGIDLELGRSRLQIPAYRLDSEPDAPTLVLVPVDAEYLTVTEALVGSST